MKLNLRILRQRAIFPVIIISLLAMTFSSSLFHCGSSTTEIVLSSVGDSTITADMVNSIFDENPRNRNLPPEKEYEIKKIILDNLASKQLLALGAMDSNLHTRPEFAARLEKERRQIAATLYFDDHVTARSQLTPDEFEQFKRESCKEASLALIRMSAPFDTALGIYEKLRIGADLAELALNYSNEKYSRNNGGLTGFRPITIYPPAVRSAIDTLQLMIYSTPIFDNDSYWIIKVMERKTVDAPNSAYDDQKLNLVAKDFKKLKLTEALSEELWKKFHPNANPDAINLFETRIRERGDSHCDARLANDSLFSDREKAQWIVKYDGGKFPLSDFLENFKVLPAPLYPVLGDSESYMRFVKRCLFDDFLYMNAEKENYLRENRHRLQWRLTYMKMLADFAAGVINSTVIVTVENVRAEYDANPHKYIEPGRAQVDEIKLSTLEDAQMVLKKISEGGRFDDLAKKYSIRAYRGKRGPDLGWVSMARYPEYYQSIGNAQQGAILGPVQLSDGYGIIRLKQKSGEAPKSFDSVESLIRSALISASRRKALEKFENELRARYSTNTNYDLLKTIIQSKRIN